MTRLAPVHVARLKIPYALRHVPTSAMATLLPVPTTPAVGDLALCEIVTLGRNTALELVDGRRCALHPGDEIPVAFAHRYATQLFEAYARADGDSCDLLSVGGLCGRVESKHATVADPTRLRILGALGGPGESPLRMRDFRLPELPPAPVPRVIAVVGSSMNAGKTHTAMSLVRGLRAAGVAVAGIKLTGTATGRDTWLVKDAGAHPALNFTDGGYPSTYLTPLPELLALHRLLLSHAAHAGARWAVIEVADGLLQLETAALLQDPGFRASVSAWVFATGDPLGAVGGLSILRDWGLAPVAVSGVVSMSQLAINEVSRAVGVPCLSAAQLQAGDLNPGLLERA